MNSGTDNQRVLGNCPSCQGLMQIPVVTDAQAQAKCPHCSNKILVRELLASLVPEAEIVEAGATEDSQIMADRQRIVDDGKPKERKRFEVPNQLYNGASRRSRKRRSKSRKSGSSRGDRSSSKSTPSRSDVDNSVLPRTRGTVGPLGAPSDATSATAMTKGTRVAPVNQPSSQPVESNIPAQSSQPVESSQPSQSVGSEPVIEQTPYPKSNPKVTATKSTVPSAPRRRTSDYDEATEFSIIDVFKFIVGGLIAAPLAYLMLLWVIGVDPFGAASVFESLSPSIVPQALRSENQNPKAFQARASNSAIPEIDTFGSNDVARDGLPKPKINPDLVR